jgi:hypothetical protein
VKLTVLHLERAVVALLPTIVLLLVGLFALAHLDPRSTHFFLFLLSVAISAILLGEYAILFLMQRTRQRHYCALIEACQECLAGQEESRPHMQGDPALLPLARMLNSLLDTVKLAHKHSMQQQRSILRHQQEQADLRAQFQSTQTAHIHLTTQLHAILRILSPVLQGNLCVRAELFPGEVGDLADLCNALIEEVIKLVRWTRSSSQQLTTQTRTLLNGTVELAQQVENQLLHFSQATESAEQMAACLQRSHGTLQISLDTLHTMQAQLQQQRRFSTDSTGFLQHLEQAISDQIHLLADVAQVTRSQVMQAETLITECYTFARDLHQSSCGVLQTAEHLAAVTLLAEQWEQEVRTFQLPELQTLPQLPETRVQPALKSPLPPAPPALRPPSHTAEGHISVHLL